MSQPTAIIAEDEPLLRAELRELLGKLWPELVICAEVSDGFEALRALNSFSPQVVFLDIQMPGLSGLEVAAQASGKAHVVFITAYDQHAIEAFEQGALDYVPKPISAARLSTTIDSVKRKLHQPKDLQEVADFLRGMTSQTPEYLKWLSVPHANELRLIMVEDICYLRADNKYTSVFTANAEFLLSSTLKFVKEKVDPRLFWQIHRSVVVNVGAIRSVSKSFRGTLELQLKQRTEVLPVSSAYAHLFKHL